MPKKTDNQPVMGRTATYSQSGFKKFWDAYPEAKREGKQQAAKEWKFGKCEALTEQILDAVLRDPALRNDDPKYIPNPANWLARRRWDDSNLPPRPPTEDELQAARDREYEERMRGQRAEADRREEERREELARLQAENKRNPVMRHLQWEAEKEAEKEWTLEQTKAEVDRLIAQMEARSKKHLPVDQKARDAELKARNQEKVRVLLEKEKRGEL